MNILSFFNSMWKRVFTKKRSTYSPKRALCVGICNYPDPRNSLSGCINDAMNWSKLLKNVKGFNTPDMLIDSQATVRAVTSKLKEMVKEAKVGDVLVFTYSGHGTSIPTVHNDEIDGRDEAICLYDGLLIDDTVSEILSLAPEGVSITMVLDSCHSGTMMRSFVSPGTDGDSERKIKYMQPSDENFAKNVRRLKVRNKMMVPHKDVPMWEMLLAGCKDNEYSYDAHIGGKPCGAFTYFATKLISENPQMTYGQFGTMINGSLPSKDYPQHPQIECNPVNVNRILFT